MLVPIRTGVVQLYPMSGTTRNIASTSWLMSGNLTVATTYPKYWSIWPPTPSTRRRWSMGCMSSFNWWDSEYVTVLTIEPVSRRAWHDLPSSVTATSHDGPTNPRVPALFSFEDECNSSATSWSSKDEVLLTLAEDTFTTSLSGSSRWSTPDLWLSTLPCALPSSNLIPFPETVFGHSELPRLCPAWPHA